MHGMIVDEDETLTIPKGYMINYIDADGEEGDGENPYFCISTGEGNPNDDDFDVKFPLPKALAHYLREMHCGSETMEKFLINCGREQVKEELKKLLGLEDGEENED